MKKMFLLAFLAMVAMGASAQMNVWENGGLSAQYAIESVDSVTFGITSVTPSSGSGKDGITPLLKIENDYWYVSYDEGQTWQQEGRAKGKDGQDGDSMFQSVTQDENYVYFTLADGTVIKIAKASEEEQPNSEFMFIVTYDANGGEGTMKPDTFYYGVSKQLSEIKYTKSSHYFTNWNTKADGTGIPYEDGQTLMISKNITLYAQWEEYLEIQFTSGVFSISDSKQVTFSPGNLQYHPANKKWRFAENQTDYIGNANSNISSNYNGWLDLFGWSTSATNFGVSTSNSNSDYSGSFVDWGINQIGNDAPNTWRTLKRKEWGYLLETRPNASSLCGVAQVNGVNGLILLPDNWTCPSGVTFKSGFHSSDGVEYYAAYQTFTAEQWSKLESAGAVFLPVAGYRGSSNVYYVQDHSYYWSASVYDNYNAYCLYFFSDQAYMAYSGRLYGRSVRLVKDLQ